MEIIFINTPLFREVTRQLNEDTLPPFGLGYIATYLQNNGCDAQIIDAVNQMIPLHELLEILNKVKPAFLGLNIFTTNYLLVKEIVESLTFNTHFIIGGLSTKEFYKKIIYWKTNNQLDVVIGDGELITLAIIKEDLKENPIFSSQNRRIFRIDGKSIYFLSEISDISINRSLFINEPFKHQRGFVEANIITSRGCIYNCTFCAAARSQNKEYPIRERTESSIIDELKQIKTCYPTTNSIRVLDDLFLKTIKHVTKAVNIFSKFDFQWRSMAHVMTFNQVEQSDLNTLKKSGCKELFIGIESGSPVLLKSLKKTSNIDQIIRNLTMIFKAKIDIKGYFIYGFPSETLFDMESTYNLAEDLKNLSIKYGSNFRTSVFQFRPYHGTELYKDLKEKIPNIEIEHITHNQALSNLIGRNQFNFHNDNYSSVGLEIIHDYICRTIKLNDPGILYNP